jgi:transcriptional repressor NrdR
VDRVYCPYCRHPDSRVIDSRTAEDGAAIRRRRSCPACGRRFTTQETVILMVAKRSGVTEPFNRDKIVRGVRRACQGRPVTEDQLAILAQRVEDAIRSRGSGEVPSHEVGLAILGPLRELDEVAYLRFASVYRGFESLADFEDEITALRTERDRAWRTGDQDGERLAGEEAVGVPARAAARSTNGITGPGQASDGTRRIPGGGEHDRDDG